MFHNYGHPEIMVTFLGYKGDSNSEVPLYLLINNMVFIYHYSIIYLNEFTTSRRFHNTLTKKILVELMATSEIISRTNDSLISNEILYANSNKWKLYITTTHDYRLFLSYLPILLYIYMDILIGAFSEVHGPSFS